MSPTRAMNPYAPPANRESEPPPSGDERRAFEPASLGRRLGGAIVDGIFGLVVYVVARKAMSGEFPSWSSFASPQALEKQGFAALLPSLVTLTVTGALIATRGQSVGKIVALTRIVDKNGRKAGLVNGFVLRTLPLSAIGILPTILMATGMPFASVQPLSMLTGLVSFVDVILIFGAERRCLHDRIGGTYVAVVGTERPPRGDRPRRPKKKKKRRKAEAPPPAGEG